MQAGPEVHGIPEIQSLSLNPITGYNFFVQSLLCKKIVPFRVVKFGVELVRPATTGDVFELSPVAANNSFSRDLNTCGA